METMQRTILIVDDDPMIREVLAGILTDNNYHVDVAVNGEEALKKVDEIDFDFILTDLDMPVMDGMTFLKKLQQKHVTAAPIVISAHADMKSVVQAMQMGARDFLAKPLQSEDEILLTLRRTDERARLEKENVRLRKEVEEKYTFANIVAKSDKMLAIFKTIAKISDYKTSVLITGESGTGKELIAKAIHFNSIRKNHPLIDINCGGIPETLLESELFGHVKGAFTDAYRTKKGLFVEADGGTLFLDELGELPLTLQVKILRALQEEEVRPLGSGESLKVNVRIIAATSREIRKEVEHGRFREDLFYRINVLTIHVPPLRERREDIPLLVSHFIKKYNARLKLDIKRVDNACMEKLLEYHWPGNVRELENVIERSMALAENDFITLRELPPEMLKARAREESDPYDGEVSIKKNMKRMEKILIAKGLERTGGNKTKAAEILEISLPALLYKIKEYAL